MASSQSFTVVALRFRSLIHVGLLLFLYMALRKGLTSFVCMELSNFPSAMLEQLGLYRIKASLFFINCGLVGGACVLDVL